MLRAEYCRCSQVSTLESTRCTKIPRRPLRVEVYLLRLMERDLH